MQKRIINTPDNQALEINFGYDTLDVKELLKQSVLLNPVQGHDYLTISHVGKGDIFICLYQNCDYYLMFEGEENFNKFLKGKSYYDCGVLFKRKSIFVSFDLSTEKAYLSRFTELFRETQIPSREGYDVYSDPLGNWYFFRRIDQRIANVNYFPSKEDMEVHYELFDY